MHASRHIFQRSPGSVSESCTDLAEAKTVKHASGLIGTKEGSKLRKTTGEVHAHSEVFVMRVCISFFHAFHGGAQEDSRP